MVYNDTKAFLHYNVKGRKANGTQSRTAWWPGKQTEAGRAVKRLLLETAGEWMFDKVFRMKKNKLDSTSHTEHTSHME